MVFYKKFLWIVIFNYVGQLIVSVLSDILLAVVVFVFMLCVKHVCQPRLVNVLSAFLGI